MSFSIKHFYKCFGCGRRHGAEGDAVVCCAVAQEIWECTGCGRAFASERAAADHVREINAGIDHDLTAATQSFASGYGNFATP